MTSSSLLARAPEEDSQPPINPLVDMAISFGILFAIVILGLATAWLAIRNTRRAWERERGRGPPLPASAAENDQQRAPDTRPSRSAQPLGGSGRRETRHGQTVSRGAAHIHPGTTELHETHTPHVRDGVPTPPPAYNSLERNVKPRPRTAPLDTAPLDLYGIPAAHLDPSNSPGELLAVQLQEGDRIGYLNANGQSEEHASTPRRDRLFYLAARFRQPERLHER
ncbi:hypothetical protein GALMADRAFT_136378 [Galerina marginata CBS 339.88]|uniref:Uncharacterized protein n=1 Tax=Galerina marginata (strain CBS 339.88) TaxID=685588 RepID=A0A067TIM0_GALM3|nr:hypothetical protein GALMADRAFT_136378 [Galerina marginata CBS 339.88]